MLWRRRGGGGEVLCRCTRHSCTADAPGEEQTEMELRDGEMRGMSVGRDADLRGMKREPETDFTG